VGAQEAEFRLPHPAGQDAAQVRHPFGETADPDLYVPRPASDAALEALLAAARGPGQGPAVLVGPPGLGKTLLLRRAGRRLGAAWKSVYLPYAALELEEFARLALGLLGEAEPGAEGGESAPLGEAAAPEASAALPALAEPEEAPVAEDVPEPRSAAAAEAPGRASDPVEALRARAREAAGRGGGIALLVDEAGSLPPGTARALGELVWRCGGSLVLVLAATDDARASRALAALGGDARAVRLAQPMTAEETAVYVAERLARTDAPGTTRERLDPATVERLHRLSGGVPRRLHDLAAQLLDAPAEQVDAAWWEALAARVATDLTAEANAGEAGEGAASGASTGLPEALEVDDSDLGPLAELEVDPSR